MPLPELVVMVYLSKVSFCLFMKPPFWLAYHVSGEIPSSFLFFNRNESATSSKAKGFLQPGCLIKLCEG
jgi:hypothetical protein